MFKINILDIRKFNICFEHLKLDVCANKELSSEEIIDFFISAAKLNGNKEFIIEDKKEDIKNIFYNELYNIIYDFVKNYNKKLQKSKIKKIN